MNCPKTGGYLNSDYMWIGVDVDESAAVCGGLDRIVIGIKDEATEQMIYPSSAQPLAIEFAADDRRRKL